MSKLENFTILSDIRSTNNTGCMTTSILGQCTNSLPGVVDGIEAYNQICCVPTLGMWINTSTFNYFTFILVSFYIIPVMMILLSIDTPATSIVLRGSSPTSFQASAPETRISVETRLLLYLPPVTRYT